MLVLDENLPVNQQLLLRNAGFIRRFLRHPAFGTQAKRMGVVARVHADGVTFRRVRKASAESVSWPNS